MRKLLMMSALAFATAFSVVPVSVGPASAQDLELRMDRDGPSLRMRDRCNPNYEDCRVDRRRDMRDDFGCSTDRALWKAERMGIRRARVVDVGRRTIDVAGRDRRGDRVIVSFGRRDRSCPVYR